MSGRVNMQMCKYADVRMYERSNGRVARKDAKVRKDAGDIWYLMQLQVRLTIDD
jgi:hypothetical protein